MWTIYYYGDRLVENIAKYGDDAVECAIKYGDNAINAMKNGIEPSLMKELDNLGIKPADYDRIGIVSKEIAERTAEAVEKTGLSAEKIEEIINTSKGYRPDPSTYLSKDYIDNHLSMFKDGGSFVMTRKQYEMFVEGKQLIGCPDNSQFIAPKSYMDHMAEVANGDISIYEKMLGFDDGYFRSGGGLVRFDVKDPSSLNLRMPSGNEYGANDHWIPGGFTDGGAPEAIINQIPNSEDYVNITFIN